MIWRTSTQVMDGLKRAYLPDTGWPRGCWATEIEAPRGRKQVKRKGRTMTRKTGPRRRADVIWAPANKNTLIGFEIKVSRMDLVRELEEPSKTEQWKQYCNFWFLAVGDPAILTGLDIPADWGILAPPSGRATRTLTTIAPAPVLSPVDQTPAWCRVVGWQAWQHYQLQLRAPAQARGVVSDDDLWEWEEDAA
jgi:hypothetical protein